MPHQVPDEESNVRIFDENVVYKQEKRAILQRRKAKGIPPPQKWKRNAKDQNLSTSSMGSLTGSQESKLVVEDQNDAHPLTGVAFSGGGIRAASYMMGVLMGLGNVPLENEKKEKSESEDFLGKIDYLSTVSGGGYTGSAYLTYVANTEGKLNEAVHKQYERMRNYVGYFFSTDSWLSIFLGIAGILFGVIILLVFGHLTLLPVAFYPIGIFAAEKLPGLVTSVETGHLTHSTKIVLTIVGATTSLLLCITRMALPSMKTAKSFMWMTALNAFAILTTFSVLFVTGTWLWHFIAQGWNVIWYIIIVILCSAGLFSLTRVNLLKLSLLVFPVGIVLWISLSWYVKMTEYKDNFSYSTRIAWLIAYIILHNLHILGLNGMIHYFYLYRLRRAFYFPKNKELQHHFDEAVEACKKGGPYWLCNTVLHDYRSEIVDPKLYPSRYQEDPCPFFFGTLWSGSKNTGYIRTHEDSNTFLVTMEKAMALSGAAFATSMGRSSVDALDRSKLLFHLLGLRMGDAIDFPRKVFLTDMHGKGFSILFNFLLLALPGAGVLFMHENHNFVWLIMASFLMYNLLMIFNLLPLDQGYIMLSSMMYQYYNMLGLKIVCPRVPPFLGISDGGHLDNLGLIELLNRKVNRIVCFDAGFDADMECSDLVWIINQFEIKKGYTFHILDKGLLQPAAKGVQKFANRKEDKYYQILDIHISYSKKETGVLYYVKLRKSIHDPHLYGRMLWWKDEFPWISTSNQFFNKSLFDAYANKGKKDALELLEYMKETQNKRYSTRNKLYILRLVGKMLDKEIGDQDLDNYIHNQLKSMGSEVDLIV